MSMLVHQPPANVGAFLSRAHRMLIGDQWRAAVSGKVVDPATARVIAEVPEGDAADVHLAVQAARQSFDSGAWRGMSAPRRMRILGSYADLVEKHAEELAALDVVNNGMPLALARAIVAGAAGGLRHAAAQAANLFGSNMSAAISGDGLDVHAYTANQPVGVAGLIIPWNGPVGSFLVKLAPAIAAGCSCVVKPAEQTPLSALRLAELALECGIPPGVVNVVTGFGPGAGQALVEHEQVDKISFTGSTAVGKRIVQLAAGNLKRVSLELGGKSPCIVFDDADPATAIAGAAMGIFANTGQLCIAASRLYVQKKSFDRVVGGIADVAKSLKIGSGFDPTTQLGPVISARQRDRVERYIESGRQDGAEVVLGGGSREGPGYFVVPTILANVNARMRIVREEVFGPVLVATPVDGIDDFIRQANDSRYGLSAGIFTTDISKAHLVAERLQAGTVWVNCYGLTHPTMPFGGFKESGWGREMGFEGIQAFLEKKSVIMRLQCQ